MTDFAKNTLFNRSVNPTGYCVAVTPANTDLSPGPCRGIYIGSAGNVTIVDLSGNTVQFVALAVGVIHPIQAKQITSATTAGSVVAVY